MTAGLVVRELEPLGRHLPWRAGGPCSAWIVVQRRDALADALALCKERGWNRTILGYGSRTAVRGGGVAGAVLRLGREFACWDPVERVAGASMSVARLAHLLGWDGGHGPGTVGASLREDEGWGPWVEAVELYRRGGYRLATLEDARKGSALITSVRLSAGQDAAPPSVRSWGWYALDDGEPGDEIRSAGLSAIRLRGVTVPEHAPGILVNLGGGTSDDFELLRRSVVDRVQTARGVELSAGIRWIGRT